MPIDIDNAGLNPPSLRDGKLEKALRRKGIAIWREQEINGVAVRVDGSIEICPPTGNADVGFIDAPRAVWIPHFGPDPLVQDRSIPEHLTGDGRMIDRHPTLGHHFLEVAVAKRVPEVPPYAQDNDLVLKVPSPE